MWPDSPYAYQTLTNEPSYRVVETKNVQYAGKQAKEFTIEVLNGMLAGKTFKNTVIPYSDDTYLYVVLNDLDQEAAYYAVLYFLSFK